MVNREYFVMLALEHSNVFLSAQIWRLWTWGRSRFLWLLFLISCSAHLNPYCRLVSGPLLFSCASPPHPICIYIHCLYLGWTQYEHRRPLNSLADKERGPGIPRGPALHLF